MRHVVDRGFYESLYRRPLLVTLQGSTTNPLLIHWNQRLSPTGASAKSYWALAAHKAVRILE